MSPVPAPQRDESAEDEALIDGLHELAVGEWIHTNCPVLFEKLLVEIDKEKPNLEEGN